MPKANYHYPGEQIGNNIIIEKDILKTQEKNHGVYWKVKCIKCNNIRSVRSDGLKANCPCCIIRDNSNYVKDNLIGKFFGSWLVISKSDKANYWHCKCMKCGTERDVFRGNLTEGISQSCGCVNSWGEQKICYLLNKNKIQYKKEYTFSDLRTDKGGVPRFDFALFKDNILLCLIEYNGRQHYTYDQNWKMKQSDFENLQKIDKLKQDYCRKNNIKLYILNKDSNLEEVLQNILNN